MDSDSSSLRAIRELICSCFKSTYTRYFCSTYIRGTLHEQSLSLTRTMKPWILLPVTLEWLKDWTFHTSMGRKWCHCNANFPQGINSHLTIQSWCTHWPGLSSTLTPLSSVHAFGNHQLLDNPVWEVLWVQSTSLHTHSLTKPPCTLMGSSLKAWSKPLPFCALSHFSQSVEGWFHSQEVLLLLNC